MTPCQRRPHGSPPAHCADFLAHCLLHTAPTSSHAAPAAEEEAGVAASTRASRAGACSFGLGVPLGLPRGLLFTPPIHGVYVAPSGWCDTVPAATASGVMLMDLDRMRSSALYGDILSGFANHSLPHVQIQPPPLSEVKRTKLGWVADQSELHTTNSRLCRTSQFAHLFRTPRRRYEDVTKTWPAASTTCAT